MTSPDSEYWTLETFTAGANTTAVWSVIAFSQLPPDMRYEAEYFQPKYLELEEQLAQLECVPLQKLSISVRSGPFGSNLLKDTYVENGVIVLRPFNIKNATTEADNLVYISEADCEAHGLQLYNPGDLVFARVGDIRGGIIPDYGRKVTISPNIIAVRVNQEKVNPFFLAVYVNTLAGLLQMERAVKPVAQPTITVDTIKNIQVPQVSLADQNVIGEMLDMSIAKRREARLHYSEAEELFLRELGLGFIILGLGFDG